MKILKEEMDSLIESENYSYEKVFDDEYANKYANYFLFLFNNERQILCKNNYITVDELLYCSYYWYSAMKKRYIEIYGEDSSIDQQQFKTLERLERATEIDWDVIKKINEEFGCFK